jgi:hypothetical protein
MMSICAWRFSHMSIDIKKFRSSTILVMLLELVMNFVLKFTERSFSLNGTPFRDKFCPSVSGNSRSLPNPMAAFLSSYERARRKTIAR